MQEYTFNLARPVGEQSDQNWIIPTQKESLIVSRSGAGCRWRHPPFQVRAKLHTGAIYVRGASRVIVVEWDWGCDASIAMSKLECPEWERDENDLAASMKVQSLHLLRS